MEFKKVHILNDTLEKKKTSLKLFSYLKMERKYDRVWCNYSSFKCIFGRFYLSKIYHIVKYIIYVKF